MNISFINAEVMNHIQFGGAFPGKPEVKGQAEGILPNRQGTDIFYIGSGGYRNRIGADRFDFLQQCGIILQGFFPVCILIALILP